MSHYYLKVYESTRADPVTARGHKSTGLAVWAGSYDGVVDVRIIYDPDTRQDVVRVVLCDHPDRDEGRREVLFQGPISAYQSTIDIVAEEKYNVEA